MSKDNIEPEDKDPILEAAGDLREDVKPNPLAAFVKPKLHMDQAQVQELEGVFTPEQVVLLSKAIQEETRKRVREATYNPQMAGQILPKDATPITDFSNLTMDAIYDLSVPIEAKEFMSADALTIHLRDTNYEARWVNKHPRRLGERIAQGFTYIVPADLRDGTEPAIKASVDSQGHYVFDDVVAMKIDKATYYAALRAAHMRAVNTTNEVVARERAAKSANAYMQSTDSGSDFNRARAAGKMQFYDPEIGI